MSVVAAVEQEDLTAEHRDAAALATMAGHALLELREGRSVGRELGAAGTGWPINSWSRSSIASTPRTTSAPRRARARLGKRSPLDNRSPRRHPRVPANPAAPTGPSTSPWRSEASPSSVPSRSPPSTSPSRPLPARAGPVRPGRPAPGGRQREPPARGGLRGGGCDRRHHDPHGPGRRDRRRHHGAGGHLHPRRRPVRVGFVLPRGRGRGDRPAHLAPERRPAALWRPRCLAAGSDGVPPRTADAVLAVTTQDYRPYY